MIFSCKDIKKAFGADEVLTSVSFTVADGERAAIVGPNGAGKTTVFKIITGALIADGGEISIKKGAVIGYLPQMAELDGNNTVYDELLTVFDDVIRLEERLRDLEGEMSRLTQPENAELLPPLLNKYEKLTHEFEERKGYEYKSRVKGVIKGLGFAEAETGLPLSKLSGGQKTRVALGKLLLAPPSLLLLDEPTNHLDIAAVEWLEDYLTKNYDGSVVIISHDRYFLDKTVTKIIDIDNGRSEVYNGNYSYFAYKKEIDRENKMKRYIDQQKEIKRQEEIIKRFRSYNREWSVRKAESREKTLAKLTRLERPADMKKIRIMLEPRTHCGNDVLHIENASKSFDRLLFENVNLDIYRGECAAFIGPNGVGKTTLFRMILGKDSGGGLIRLGAGVKIGYYDQEQELLNDAKSIFDEISDTYPNRKIEEIRTTLAAFMFYGDDVFKLIGTLSGGEKARVALAKLMLGPANLLMLDEPTNHLDMFSKEVLEEALRNYTGTVFYISHDRYFINNTADKIIELNPDGSVVYSGDYDYYLLKKTERETAEVSPVSTPETDSKLERKRKKNEISNDKKRQNQLKRLENDIESAEERLKSVEAELERSEVNTDAELAHKFFEEKIALEQRILELFEQWDSLSDNGNTQDNINQE